MKYGPMKYDPVKDLVIPGSGVAGLRFAAKEHVNWNSQPNLV